MHAPAAPRRVDVPKPEMETALRETSRTVQTAQKIKEDGLFDKLTAAGGLVGSVAGYLADVDKVVLLAIVLCAAAFIVWRQIRKDRAADRIIGFRIDDAMTGKHIGRPEATLIAATEALTNV